MKPSPAATPADEDVRLQALLARSPFLAVLVLDRAGTILQASGACAQTFGREPADLARQASQGLFADRGDAELFVRAIGDTLDRGEASQPRELAVRGRAAGRPRWVLLHLQLIPRAGAAPGEVACMAVDITRHKHNEQALREVAQGFSSATGEKFFRSLVEHLARTLDVEFVFVGQLAPGNTAQVESVALWSDGRLDEASFRYDLAGTPCENVISGSLCVHVRGVQQLFPRDELLAKMGVESYLGTPLHDSSGQVIGLLVTLGRRPLAEPELAAYTLQIFAARAAAELDRKREEMRKAALEEQLRKAQKLEAIGTLAGGVAHDFNNLMTGVLGHAWLIQEHARDRPDLLRAAEVITKTAERAADLTRKLLGFARQGRTQSVSIDVHVLVREVHELLAHTLGENIAIRTELAASSALVTGDPGQLHQVLLNLALNARDAMADGGVLRFATETITLPSAARAGPADLAPGDYLKLSVSDTGVGIPKEAQERIFDPFFTTKQVGKGSGLGLAMAYGILKSHGGSIEVESEEGKGATFGVYLPLARGV